MTNAQQPSSRPGAGTNGPRRRWARASRQLAGLGAVALVIAGCSFLLPQRGVTFGAENRSAIPVLLTYVAGSEDGPPSQSFLLEPGEEGDTMRNVPIVQWLGGFVLVSTLECVSIGQLALSASGEVLVTETLIVMEVDRQAAMADRPPHTVASTNGMCDR